MNVEKRTSQNEKFSLSRRSYEKAFIEEALENHELKLASKETAEIFTNLNKFCFDMKA